MKTRPPQLALTQCTDSGSGGLEHGDQFDPTPMLDRPGVIWACKRSFPLYGAQIFGALRFS